MNGEIAVAGFVLTAEEWEEIDPVSKAQMMADEWQVLDPPARTPLMAMLTPREEPWVVAGLSTIFPVGSAPHPCQTDATSVSDQEIDDDLT